MGRAGRVQSFMLNLGRFGLGHFTCGLGWVGSKNGPTSNSCLVSDGSTRKQLSTIKATLLHGIENDASAVARNLSPASFDLEL